MVASSRDGSGKSSSSSRRRFLKMGAGALAGAAVVSVAGVPFAGGAVQGEDSKPASLRAQLESAVSQVRTMRAELDAASRISQNQQKQVNRLQAQTNNLQVELDTTTAFLTLAVTEQSLVAAVAETIIPSDSNGPGAKEAGVVYFIDRQLASDYGKSGNMYMEGPFVLTGDTRPVTVGGITYPYGTPTVRVGSGERYQYGLNMREFWRAGLQALQTYANAAYGGNFETLSAANQLTCLQDLWNSKPVSFNDIVPQDFAYELTFMSWCGFLMDPVYGGNQGMVGWTYTGFNGTNFGNFYGEGLTQKQLMVSTTPTQLQPASLGQYQKGSP